MLKILIILCLGQHVVSVFMVSYRWGETAVPSEAENDSSIHLNMADISINNADNLIVVKTKITASKKNQFRKGVDIFIGGTYNQLCPVEALMTYVAVRGQDDGLFFNFKDDWFLTKGRFVTSVWEALIAPGIDAKKFAGHSFQLGAAATAAKKAISAERIQILGRWESSAYLLHIRLSRKELSSVSKLLSTR